jgi:hypothetical protein
VGIVEVVTADELGVLRGLISAEVGDEAAVAEGMRVAVEDQHGAGVAGAREDLAGATVAVKVAAENAGFAASEMCVSVESARGAGCLGCKHLVPCTDGRGRGGTLVTARRPE